MRTRHCGHRLLIELPGVGANPTARNRYAFGVCHAVGTFWYSYHQWHMLYRLDSLLKLLLFIAQHIPRDLDTISVEK